MSTPSPSGIALAGAACAALALLAAPVQDAPFAPDVPRLAAHHPDLVIFELAAGTPPEPTLEWLGGFPELGQATVDFRSGLAGETRIRFAPAGPVAGSTLRALGQRDLEQPSLRWVTAPAARTWGFQTLSRGAMGMGALALMVALSLGREVAGGAARAAPVLGAVALGAWALGPLPPLALLAVPLALAVGAAVGARSVGRAHAGSLTAAACLPALLSGHPVGVAVGALCLAGALGGLLADGWRDAGGPSSPIPGRALAGIALGLIAGATLAPSAPPLELLDPVPHTATFAADDPQARAIFDQRGLGAVEALGEGVLAVPLVSPDVEPFLADTAATLPGVWSAPVRAAFVPSWAGGLLWVGLALGLTLGRSRTPAEAAAWGLVAVAPAAAVAWGLASAPAAAIGVGTALLPLAASVGLLGRQDDPDRALGLLGAAGLPFLIAGFVAPEAWFGTFEVWATAGLGWALLASGLVVASGLRAAPAGADGTWPGPLARRWAPRLAFAAVFLLHVDVITLLLVSYAPPPPGELPDDLRGEPIHEGDTTSFGPNRRVRDGGVFVLSTRGAPYPTGFAGGRLADDLRVRLEDELFASFGRTVPNAAARWLITRGSALVGVTLDDALLPEHREELRGDVDAAPERFWLAGPSYTRKVYYHAIHDIGQALVDTPLLGCTGFAASPEVTPDGHWRVARAFDFDGGVAFDRDKVIRVHRPDEGIPFMSVSFAGIVGAVSGVNAEGIAVVINASGSDDPPVPGTPMTLIVREILQHATSLEDAERILASRAGFVSENVLVVDADADAGALFEVSPARVERIDVDRSLAVSNHFRSPAFAAHTTTLARLEALTTVPRLRRTEELVAAWSGDLDQEAGANVLSDRAAVGGRELPRGHRQALDADIATHGVVIDATDRSLWVSAYPNLSGGWVSLRLEDALAGDLHPTPEIPADRDAWRAVEIRQARELLRAARRSRGIGALNLARRAHALWPDHPEPLFERGRLELAHGDADVGRSLLEAARAAPLEYTYQERDVDALLGGR